MGRARLCQDFAKASLLRTAALLRQSVQPIRAFPFPANDSARGVVNRAGVLGREWPTSQSPLGLLVAEHLAGDAIIVISPSSPSDPLPFAEPSSHHHHLNLTLPLSRSARPTIASKHLSRCTCRLGSRHTTMTAGTYSTWRTSLGAGLDGGQTELVQHGPVALARANVMYCVYLNDVVYWPL